MCVCSFTQDILGATAAGEGIVPLFAWFGGRDFLSLLCPNCHLFYASSLPQRTLLHLHSAALSLSGCVCVCVRAYLCLSVYLFVHAYVRILYMLSSVRLIQ